MHFIFLKCMANPCLLAWQIAGAITTATPSSRVWRALAPSISVADDFGVGFKCERRLDQGLHNADLIHHDLALLVCIVGGENNSLGSDDGGGPESRRLKDVPEIFAASFGLALMVASIYLLYNSLDRSISSL